AVRDSDAVVENRMLELKAATGRQDIITLRKSAAIGSPVTLMSAWIRGQLDALALSFRVLFGRGGSSSKQYMEQINQIERDQFGHLDALPEARPAQIGFVTTEAKSDAPKAEVQGPKSPAPWI